LRGRRAKTAPSNPLVRSSAAAAAVAGNSLAATFPQNPANHRNADGKSWTMRDAVAPPQNECAMFGRLPALWHHRRRFRQIDGSGQAWPTFRLLTRVQHARLNAARWARSSAGEHTLHTGGVRGSIPLAPTSRPLTWAHPFAPTIFRGAG